MDLEDHMRELGPLPPPPLHLQMLGVAIVALLTLAVCMAIGRAQTEVPPVPAAVGLPDPTRVAAPAPSQEPLLAPPSASDQDRAVLAVRDEGDYWVCIKDHHQIVTSEGYFKAESDAEVAAIQAVFGQPDRVLVPLEEFHSKQPQSVAEFLKARGVWPYPY